MYYTYVTTVVQSQSLANTDRIGSPCSRQTQRVGIEIILQTIIAMYQTINQPQTNFVTFVTYVLYVFHMQCEIYMYCI